MQNKGLVKLFALLFGLVSIYQLSFTFKANQVEKQAKEIAVSKIADTESEYDTKRNQEETRYLDSLLTTQVETGEVNKQGQPITENIKVFDMLIADYSYKEVKEKSMNLGLDLKGGISVILQISVEDILKGLANGSSDPVFLKALADAHELQKDSQKSYLEDFYESFEAIKGDTKLASPDIFANRDLSEEITFNMTDSEVKPILSKKVDESIVSAFEVLRKRIDQFGVTQPNIQRLGNSGRILVELPGVKDKQRATELITTTAQLEFWYAFKGEEFLPFLVQADGVLKDLVDSDTSNSTTDETTEPQDTETTESDQITDLLGQTSTDTTTVAVKNPLIDLIKGQGYQGGPIVALFDAKDKDKVNEYLNRPQVRALLSTQQRYVKFAWGVPAKDSELVELYALQGNREDNPPLSGAVITDARNSFSPNGKPTVSMQMNAKGAKIWEEMTGKAFNTQGQIAIVLDNIVYSAPGVTTGAISGGNSEISGQFTLNEAIDLANVLRAGKLPARAEIVQADVVGPSLGKEAIDSGMKSFIVALILVLLWMVFYYGIAGIFSDIALMLNILLIFGVLSGLGAVLTLPGIAGIVLTVGIAVDANVLIYERIREELDKGKGQKDAVRDGFSNALSSILDANITTGLTALILFIFGTGPIKGFATTLLIGIVTSLFTAIYISRLLIDWYVNKGKQLNFSTSVTKGLFRNISINFLKKRKVAYIVSGTIILAGLVSLFTTGLDQGIDFVGGRTYTVRFAQDLNAVEIGDAVHAELGSAEIKTIGGANQLKISTKYKIDENSTEIDEEVQNKLYQSLTPFLPDGMDYNEFSSPQDNVGIMYSGKVSPTIADDIKKSSIWAILGSLIVVFLYILLRFKKWQFSLGAVTAVFHDVLIVLGIYSITWRFMPFSMEIDQAFIAAILTVIGYSLNDTVVVFDRIREYFNEHTSWKIGRTVNNALNSTLSRTLNTSLTTLVVLLAMFIFGADSLRDLLFALIVGVVVGTYSSVFIATPIMYDTVNKAEEKE